MDMKNMKKKTKKKLARFSKKVIKGTAKDLDAMRKNTLTIYKQYEEVKKMFEEEQGELRVHGGRKESIFEKGELLDLDD